MITGSNLRERRTVLIFLAAGDPAIVINPHPPAQNPIDLTLP